jgi:Lrp/AsnC family transcriptional regulator
MDSYDRHILELLQTDATLSVGEVAERVALSKTACWRRVRKLEEAGVIRGRVTLLRPASVNLGLTVYVVVRTNQHNDTWARRFSEVIADIPEVLEAYRMSGDLDYLLKAVVSDMDGYDRLYKKLIRADLFDVSSSFVMETLKHTTALPLDQVTAHSR